MSAATQARVLLDRLRALPAETEWLEFKAARTGFTLEPFLGSSPGQGCDEGLQRWGTLSLHWDIDG